MSDAQLYFCGTCKNMLGHDSFYWRKRGAQAGQRMTTCKGCNVLKVKDWNKRNPVARKRTVFKYDEKHRERTREYSRRHRENKTLEEKRAPHLKRSYGMTIADYNALLLKQGGKCALCLAVSARPSGGHLCVDHDHDTGRIRGLLCVLCNTAIGLLGDDPKRLLEAAKYLSTDNALTRAMAGA